MPNPVAHFQILSKSPDDTARFYTSLFGWTVDANNAMGYRRFNMGTKEGIDGGIWQAPPQAQNFVQLFVSVEDVKSSIQKAEGLGAKVIFPATIGPDGDEMAVLLDPQGTPFGLWRKKS
jgi:hypothetical protein